MPQRAMEKHTFNRVSRHFPSRLFQCGTRGENLNCFEKPGELKREKAERHEAIEKSINKSLFLLYY